MYKDYNTIGKDVSDIFAIKQSIQNILMTPKGTLPGKPTFGSDLYKLAFAPLDSLTESLAKNFVTEALEIWEDRIDISQIVLTKSEAYNKLIITVHFTYDDDNDADDEPIESTAVSI